MKGRDRERGGSDEVVLGQWCGVMSCGLDPCMVRCHTLWLRPMQCRYPVVQIRVEAITSHHITSQPKNTPAVGET